MISNIATKYRHALFALVVIGTAGAVCFLPRLQFDAGFSQFLPKGDPDLAFYEAFKAEMGDSDRFLAIGIEPQSRVFEQAFLENVRDFNARLGAIPGIHRVSSLLELEYPQKTPFGTLSLPYLHVDEPESLESDSQRVFRDFEVTQHFITPEGKALVVWVELEEGSTDGSTRETLDSLASLRRQFPAMATYVSGKKYMEAEYAALLAGESNDFILLVAGFTLAVLLLIFRSWAGIVVPVVVVGISLVLFYGLLAATGRSLGIMSNLFPTVILIVGISDIIHLSIHYQQERQKGATEREAAQHAIRDVGRAIFLTTLTTAIGFLSFCNASMPAMRNFGIEAASGVVLAYLVTICVAPFVFLGAGKKASFALRPYFFSLTQKLFAVLERWYQRPRVIILAFLLAAGLLSTGIFFINTNHLQLSNVPDDSDLKAGLDFFEHRAGGARVFEIAVTAAGDAKLNDLSSLQEIRKLHLYLESLGYLNAVRSPCTYYHVLSKMEGTTDTSRLALPPNDARLRRIEKTWRSTDTRLSLLSPDKTMARISARLPDPGRKKMEQYNAAIQHWMDEHLDGELTRGRITGMDYLIDRGHAQRISNMVNSLWQAILIVAIIVAIIFRRAEIVFLALIVNLLPLIMTAGIMGFTGIELRGATSMVFSLGFMIAIDNTIHFLNRLQIERKAGVDLRPAVKNALYQCGCPMLITTLILIGGFSVLMHSAFMEVFAYGELLSALFFFAIFADMLLLQALVLTVFKKSL